MKYLLFIFFAGCTLNAKHQDPEKQKDDEFNKLIEKVSSHHNEFKEVHAKASKKEDKLVTQAITKIVTLKSEVKDLKSEISEMKVRVDTIIIRDTIIIKEKKSFWGKTKVDTTKTN
jgi:hypothetical protein